MKLPEAFTDSYGKVTAASSGACFAISIRGKNIDAVAANTCNPEYGKWVGLVPAGSTVEIEGIPRDDGHEIDIFYVTNAAGCQPREASDGIGNKPDSGVVASKRGFGADNVYMIARQPLGELGVGDNFVTVTVNLPHPSNALSAIAELGIPDSCNSDPVVLTQVESTAGMVSGSKTLTAPSGKIMHLRMKDQRIEIRNPTNFHGRLAPHRLGERQ